MSRFTQTKKLLGRHSKTIAFVGGTLFLIVILLAILALNKRQGMLDQALVKIQSRAKSAYSVDLSISEAGFSGMKTIRLGHMQVKSLPDSSASSLDSIPFLQARDARISLKLWPLLRGEVQLSKVSMNQLLIQAVTRDSATNYGFLSRQDRQSGETPVQDAEAEERNFAKRLDGLLGNIFRSLPINIQMEDVAMRFQTDSSERNLHIADFSMKRGDFDARIEVDGQIQWAASGQIRPQRQQLFLKVEALESPSTLPILEDVFGLKVGFDLLEMRLAEVKKLATNELKLSFSGHIEGASAYHPRISEQSVELPQGHFDGELLVGKEYVELTENSRIQVERLEAIPYLKYSAEPAAAFDFSLETPLMEAQDFFDAWPRGLFSSLDGIRVSGKLKYVMSGHFDTSNPDDIVFDSQLENHDFAVNSWGKVNPTHISGTFEHTPFGEDEAQSSFLVGPENPDFVRLGEISPHIKNAVLTTEDPSFFSHKGFVMESIRSSIATNYKEKAFVRGGSTISMQLVKNVFLHHNKTMLRKLEEILLVWLIENTRAVSKERMYEVYLNIIEWGRNIYGIGPASRYYFGKHASELSVGESIYLASIVPKPKSGLYAFDHRGRLKPYMYKYYDYVGQIMQRRGLIPPAEHEGNYGYYSVVLEERLRPAQPLGADTLKISPPEMRFDFILPHLDNENNNRGQAL